jgi:hypothetical protein
MEKIGLIKSIGLVLIFLSLLVIFIEPFHPFTGFSIAEHIFQTTSYPIYLLSLILFSTGVFLLFIKDETHPASIVEAVANGVPLEEAKKIWNESNERATSGRWVQLKTIGPNRAKNRKYAQATSLCKYWGPEFYRGLSGRNLKALYENGKLGKTHEIYRGSDAFSHQEISHPQKGHRVMHRHWEIAEMHKNGVKFD